MYLFALCALHSGFSRIVLRPHCLVVIVVMTITTVTITVIVSSIGAKQQLTFASAQNYSQVEGQ